MRKVASHTIFWKKAYPLSYLTLDDSGAFLGVRPLDGEAPGIEFYDGAIYPVPLDEIVPIPTNLPALTEKVSIGDQVKLYRLHQMKVDPIR